MPPSVPFDSHAPPLPHRPIRPDRAWVRRLGSFGFAAVLGSNPEPRRTHSNPNTLSPALSLGSQAGFVWVLFSHGHLGSPVGSKRAPYVVGPFDPHGRTSGPHFKSSKQSAQDRHAFSTIHQLRPSANLGHLPGHRSWMCSGLLPVPRSGASRVRLLCAGLSDSPSFRDRSAHPRRTP